MGTPAARGHSQQLPASHTPGNIFHKLFGKASFQLLQSVAQQELCSPPVPEPGGTSGISLAGISLPLTVQFCSCPSSKVPWGRGMGILTVLWPHCVRFVLSEAPVCPVSQLCPATAQCCTGIPSRGEQALSTKLHLHLLTAQLLKALLLPGLV